MFIYFSLSTHHSSFLLVSPSAWSVHLRRWKPRKRRFCLLWKTKLSSSPLRGNTWFVISPHICILSVRIFLSILSTAAADTEAWPLANMWPGPRRTAGGLFLYPWKEREEKRREAQMQMDWWKFPVYLQRRQHVTSTLSLCFCHCNALRSIKLGAGGGQKRERERDKRCRHRREWNTVNVMAWVCWKRMRNAEAGAEQHTDCSPWMGLSKGGVHSLSPNSIQG